MTKAYTETLLKVENPSNGSLTACSRSSPWLLKPTQRLSWKMKILLTATSITYSGSSPWW